MTNFLTLLMREYKNMQVYTESLGPFATNAYILDWTQAVNVQKRDDIFYAIDAPWGSFAYYKDFAEKNKKTLSTLFLTHSHQDHIGDVAQIVDYFDNIQIVIANNELDFLLLPGSDGLPLAADVPAMKKKHYSKIVPVTIPTSCASHNKLPSLALPTTLKRHTNIPLPTLFHCPGHSTGSICYFFEDSNTLFSGDTIMHGTCGRIDLPGGSKQEMLASLQRIPSTFKGSTLIFSGHGPSTTLAAESTWLSSIEYML